MKDRKDENLLPLDADQESLMELNDALYTRRFQNEADALLAQKIAKHNGGYRHAYESLTHTERKLLRFFHPLMRNGFERTKRIDPIKAKASDWAFSHIVITRILDYSTEPSLLSGLSTKWRECFESPVLDLAQREDVRVWRYFKRCLNSSKMIRSLMRFKGVPLALDYLLDTECEKELLDAIVYWANQKSDMAIADFIFTRRPDLQVKVFHKLKNLIALDRHMETFHRMQGVKHHSFGTQECYDHLAKYMKVHE